MTLLVDTSVWSLLLRREAPPEVPEVAHLRSALLGEELVATTGIIVQELLDGALPGSTRDLLIERLSGLTYLAPGFADHVAAAHLRNDLRAKGVQLGAVDALIAELAIAGGHTLLTTDRDFHHAARHIPLRVWQ